MMKSGQKTVERIYVVCGLFAVLSAAAFGSDVVDLTFDAPTAKHYNRATTSAVSWTADGETLVIRALSTGKVETAWTVCTKKTSVPAEVGAYALAFEIKCPTEWTRVSMSRQWGSDITWSDATGKTLAVHPIHYRFRKGDFARFRFCGKVPSGAAAVVVRLGTDGPNVAPGEDVIVRKLRMAWLPKGTAVPADLAPDLEPPLVRSAFEAPTTDANVTVRYDFIDAGGIDWRSVSVTVAKTKAAVAFARDGNRITLKPGKPWQQGVNTLVIRVKDVSGNETVSHKSFLIGDRPKGSVTRLRDDGVMLVDGEPFFPIGIYGIKLHAFNAWNFDRALSDLRAAGFNFAHSYTHSRDAEFLRLCDKHGFKSWTGAYDVAYGDNWLVTTGRHDRATVTWYIGDDTAMYMKPCELLDRDEAAHKLDGTRITCQADCIHSESYDDGYLKYARHTDVFLPEIYPILGDDKTADERCVAVTIRDMERARSDIAACADDARARTLWPILQIFHGKVWHRYPTHDETYATTFAALIHGGKGVTWFHYCGSIDEDNGYRYSGCFRTRADWVATTNMTRRIAEISPVLLARDPVQPPPPEIVEGPKTDPLGQPSVTMLMKRHDGATYVLAVNASPKPVRARLRLTSAGSLGEVLWESRKVSATDGRFEDAFAGFAVHVYRFKD